MLLAGLSREDMRGRSYISTAIHGHGEMATDRDRSSLNQRLTACNMPRFEGLLSRRTFGYINCGVRTRNVLEIQILTIPSETVRSPEQ